MDRDCKILSIPSDVCRRLFSEEAVCVCAVSGADILASGFYREGGISCFHGVRNVF